LTVQPLHDASPKRLELAPQHAPPPQVDGVNLSFFHAQHVLGAVMALIEIGNVRVLYTGDYSREPDRHLPMAEIPSGACGATVTHRGGDGLCRCSA
jgi:cleavage and polyadenylation specificity factor subunit 3